MSTPVNRNQQHSPREPDIFFWLSLKEQEFLLALLDRAIESMKKLPPEELKKSEATLRETRRIRSIVDGSYDLGEHLNAKDS